MLESRVQETIQDAAQKLTGARKRAFMAKVAIDYFDGSARKTETYLGWNRKSVQVGLHEHHSGTICIDNYRARGRQSIEAKLPRLEADIRDLVEEHTQADPKFQSTFCYLQVSARAVREALIEVKGYEDSDLPTRQTMGNLLNRMGYRLKKRKK
ncbi:hypothetical protein N836_02035 [Leptolyngbya sp. Heron Island J]|uniref:ISAzo13-like element transposase-related protein n=1 Tax=Leptolyngbya sp. Heron Island J TaxID=1385935 RepID=UPI0003B954FE|nr:hypothetical protein [Leptolyngbya sp. Heron Island J]ESA32814.1 hypothetical protein N836_02035 [Leptolyngbya sp. Heron Island J]